MEQKKEQGKTRLGGRVWAALLAFGLIGQIAWVVENMYFNVFLYNTITGDTKMIAAMVSASAVVAAVTTLAVGALSDKLGMRKKIIVAGYLLWGLSVMAFALVRVGGLEALVGPARAVRAAAVTVIVLDCVMTFFGSSANDAAFNAWVTDVTNDGNRGRVEAVLAVMPLVAMLVVFGALDGLTAAGNWTAFFLIVGGLTMLGGGLGHLLIREPEGIRPAEGKYFANILYGLRPGVIWANPALYLSLLALAVYAASQQVYMPYLIIYIQRYLGVDSYALILGTVLVAASIVSVACGKAIDRRGKLNVAVPAAIAAFAGLMCMFFVRSTGFVILSLPVAGIGAYLGIWLCGLENNIYFQIGLVMLVGLVAKNAILIVEFAKEEVEKGCDTVSAALTAARLRFRPIVMTSLAFILGLLPLVVASGPGSASRQGIGTGVFFGMLVAITVGIVFVPFFFVWIYRIKNRLKR